MRKQRRGKKERNTDRLPGSHAAGATETKIKIMEGKSKCGKGRTGPARRI